MASPSLPAPGLLRRLAAGLYDGLLVIALWFIGTLLVLPLSGDDPIGEENPFFLLYLLVLTGLFFGWFWYRSGQTLGMQAWRIRVLDAEDRPPRPGQIIQRVLLLLGLIVSALYGLVVLALESMPDWLGIVLLLPLCLSMAWMLVDGEARCLHDRLSGTRLALLPKR